MAKKNTGKPKDRQGRDPKPAEKRRRPSSPAAAKPSRDHLQDPAKITPPTEHISRPVEGAVVQTKDGRAVGWSWSRDVQLPLRYCDYEVPIVARLHPFKADSPEEAVPMGMAGGLLSSVPFWRRFKQWPIGEANGVRGHRAPANAYAELRRVLTAYGYGKQDFEPLDLPEIEELLTEGQGRRGSGELLADPEQLQALRAKMSESHQEQGLIDTGKPQATSTEPRMVWPPIGYTRTNDLSPRLHLKVSTVRYWAEKDKVAGGPLEGKIKRHPSTGELAYPDAWLEARREGHKPRST